MARLRINDGYTLSNTTKPPYDGGPTVTFDYRPAMADAVYEWQIAFNRATTGKAQHDANSLLIAGHVVSWDVLEVTGQSERPAEVNLDNAKKIPREIAEDMVNAICTWHAKGGPERDAGN